jgi:hypothetical protein
LELRKRSLLFADLSPLKGVGSNELLMGECASRSEERPRLADEPVTSPGCDRTVIEGRLEQGRPDPVGE